MTTTEPSRVGVCIVRAASRERIIGRWAFCWTGRLAHASHEIWNGPKLIYGSDNEFYLAHNHFNNSLWNRVLWCYYTECLRWGWMLTLGWNESLPALAAVRLKALCGRSHLFVGRSNLLLLLVLVSGIGK